MTPEELEALADGVEATPCYVENPWIGQTLGHPICLSPNGTQLGKNYLRSLDDAASVMPEGWQVNIHHLGYVGKYRVEADCLADRRLPQVSAVAHTECAARVAAGLRARAREARRAADNALEDFRRTHPELTSFWEDTK